MKTPSLILGCAFLAISTLFAVERPWDPAEKWEGAIAAFEKEDAENPPADHPIVFTGSSSVRLWDLEAGWPGVNAINRGFGGSTIYDTIHFFDRTVAPYEPKAIVIYAGDNDVAKELSVDQVVADYKKLASMVKKQLPDTPLIYVAIKPSVKRWDMWPSMKAVNDRIAEICAKEKNTHLFFADIAAPMLKDTEDAPPPADLFVKDGLHLSPKGYAMWEEVVTEQLKAAGALK